MIPAFDEQGFLPLGLHDASLPEIRAALSFTPRRRMLISGLYGYVRIWNQSSLLDYLILDGSFVTSKPEPGDIDMILVPKPEGLTSRLGELARTLCYDREFTKAEFGCEAFLVSGLADLDGWLDFFSHDRQGNVRGLLRLRFPL